MRGAGGRGNTAGGAAGLILSWPTLVMGMAIWVLARLLARSSFVATRTWWVLLPFVFGLMTRSWWYALLGMALSPIYLKTQRLETDDHLLIKDRWPSLWAFLTGRRRK